MRSYLYVTTVLIKMALASIVNTTVFMFIIRYMIIRGFPGGTSAK